MKKGIKIDDNFHRVHCAYIANIQLFPSKGPMNYFIGPFAIVD